MSTLSSERIVGILKQYDREGHVEPSPRSGQLRVHYMNNDVSCAIDLMGGIKLVAQMLDVSIDEIDRWIDEHYVPEPYASNVQKRTGYSIWSIQQPTFYVFDGGFYWPHAPTPEELQHPMGVSIYRKRLPQGRTRGKTF